MDELAAAIQQAIAETEVGAHGATGQIRMLQEQWPPARAIAFRTVIDQERDAELALRPIDVPGQVRARRIGGQVYIGRLDGLSGDSAGQARQLRMKEHAHRLAVEAVSLRDLAVAP